MGCFCVKKLNVRRLGSVPTSFWMKLNTIMAESVKSDFLGGRFQFVDDIPFISCSNSSVSVQVYTFTYFTARTIMGRSDE
jgi:hypothetical protein